ncbi:formate dehydrogenase accessory sulfurtransferase FdhD [Cyclobacterium plantarum]|uniref:Sulfur carrier protein FdhD n=1 Tax=Cyclobacterium plantarum TaxID=2716263 RepID=A0ABX0H374_9BACT|nr:formate dehydrogenase accessory sulfurtransferase FdhD [Cyclobacterium plantarum]NHE56265.1 formate dehydrogenase accessory sulfurtransferase FdhD [Cyclobacterium plantarum]
MMGSSSLVVHGLVVKYEKENATSFQDLMAMEEPLQIRLEFEKSGIWHKKDLLVTMRSPGDDFDLATGFLYSEGIIRKEKDILLMRYCRQVKEEEKGNVLLVRLAPNPKMDLLGLDRSFYTHSSCGVCGKTAIGAVKCKAASLSEDPEWQVDPETLMSLSGKLHEHQTGFKYTGGLHAAVLYDARGKMELIREDVGRHNALDKLIGGALRENIPVDQRKLVLLSGRVSFEMVQKSVTAGIPLLVAFGAPTSLAVDLARDKKMTLIGFLKKDGFNVYTGQERIKQWVKKSLK